MDDYGWPSMAKTATESRMPIASFLPSGASEKEFAKPGMWITRPGPGTAGFHKYRASFVRNAVNRPCRSQATCFTRQAVDGYAATNAPSATRKIRTGAGGLVVLPAAPSDGWACVRDSNLPGIRAERNAADAATVLFQGEGREAEDHAARREVVDHDIQRGCVCNEMSVRGKGHGARPVPQIDRSRAGNVGQFAPVCRRVQGKRPMFGAAGGDGQDTPVRRCHEVGRPIGRNRCPGAGPTKLSP